MQSNKLEKAVNFNGNMSIVFEGSNLNQCDDAEAIRLAVKHLRELLTTYD